MTHLNFIFFSTDSKSFHVRLKGAPGVASSMKRPNSGWKIGMVSSILSTRDLAFRIYPFTTQGRRRQTPLVFSYWQAPVGFRLAAERDKRAFSPRHKRQQDTQSRILYVRPTRSHPEIDVGLSNLISPQQNIPFVSSILLPYFKKLL